MPLSRITSCTAKDAPEASALIIASTLSEFIKFLHTLAASSGFALLSLIINSILRPSKPPLFIEIIYGHI